MAETTISHSDCLICKSEMTLWANDTEGELGVLTYFETFSLILSRKHGYDFLLV